MTRLVIAFAIAGLTAPAFAAEAPLTAQQLQARKQAELVARCQYAVQPAGAPDQSAPDGKRGMIKLSDAPPARMERAVNRTINGCPVPVYVGRVAERK